MAIDINADVGEGFDDEALMPHLTSVSIACGGHAGDEASMARAVVAAAAHGLLLGAHPSYPDREGFGRRAVDIGFAELFESLRAQVAALVRVAAAAGLQVTHVKAHGALYNRAWDDEATAEVVSRAASAAPGAALFCPPGSLQESVARAHGLDVVSEGFADRAYDANRRLVARDAPGAVLSAVADIARQLQYLRGMGVRTVCVHGDSPGAAGIAAAVQAAAAEAGLPVAGYRQQ